MSSAYCRALGIEAPLLQELVGHAEANGEALLLAALLVDAYP